MKTLIKHIKQIQPLTLPLEGEVFQWVGLNGILYQMDDTGLVTIVNDNRLPVYGVVAPSVLDNIAAGYPLGIFWQNTTNGYLYNHILDGVWKRELDTRIEWDDILPSTNWGVALGSAAPDIVTPTIAGQQLTYYGFDGNSTEERLSSNFEILHNTDIASLNDGVVALEIHIHGRPSSNNSGEVKIFFDLIYSPVNRTPEVWTTVSVIIPIAVNQQYMHKIQGVSLTIPPSTYNIGDLIGVRVRRTPTDPEDTYPNDWLFDQCALHAPIDTKGSRTKYDKY